MYSMGVLHFNFRDIWGDHCWYLLVAKQCVDILSAVKMSRMILADIKPRASKL
jgi:hypothetical protein